MKKTSIFLLLVMIIFACDEIFEEDISNATLEIIAPRDNLVTAKTTLVFWWNELPDANSYKLQIVSTSFDTILSNPVDSNLTKNKFEVTLNPGKYSWRVKAMNSATETEWVTQRLTILDVPDLTEQEVSLVSPKEQDAFNFGKIKFQWNKLPNATKYRVIIKEDTWIGNTVFQSETVYDTLTLTLDEKKFVWGVEGINDYSKSKTQKKTFFVDLTAPGKPTLQKPVNNTTITGTSTNLEWIHTTTDATTVYDSVYIAKENNFSSANIIEKVKVTSPSHSFSSSTYKGKVSWKVKAIDKAGNKSVFSETFSFTLE